MSARNSLLNAIRAGKDILDAKRQMRLERQRDLVRSSVGRERTDREGFFAVRDSAPTGTTLLFKPYSATIESIYRKGWSKVQYRSRESGRFTSRATASRIRGSISARTAYNTLRSRFPTMNHDEAIDKVNRLTELSARRALGEDVDLEIGDIFGYPM